MNDGYKLLDLTLILYLFLPGRKRLDGEVLDHKLFPYIIRCVVFYFDIAYCGFTFTYGIPILTD